MRIALALTTNLRGAERPFASRPVRGRKVRITIPRAVWRLRRDPLAVRVLIEGRLRPTSG